MIEFKHVALHYHYDEYPLLKDLNFKLFDGINTILCDTQSGKSSICKLLLKEFKPTSGQIFFDKLDIESITNEGLGILYLPTMPVLFENRSVAYNIEYPLKVRKINKTERSAILSEVLLQVGFENIDRKVKKLSATEKKRVAVIRGLTVPRKIVLLDDFCDNGIEQDEILNLFPNSVKIILTSDINLARGNVVVLDGGYTAYQGDVDGAKKCVSNLSYLFDDLRSV